MDFVFVGLILAFFGATVWLARFCASLMHNGGRS